MSLKRKRGASAPSTDNVRPAPVHIKLPKLPAAAHVTKHPLLHPAIPSKFTSGHRPRKGDQQDTVESSEHLPQQKVIYVSTKTPFRSATSRAIKLLDQVDLRATQSALDNARKPRPYGQGAGTKGKGNARGAPDKDLDEAIREADSSNGSRKEEVKMTGSGRAVEKVLGMGVWFMGREGYKVRVRTGSVATIDEVSVEDVEESAGEPGGQNGAEQADAHDSTTEPTGKASSKATDAVAGSRIRHVSIVEVFVSRT